MTSSVTKQLLTEDGQVPGLTLTQSDCMRSVYRCQILHSRYRSSTVSSLERRGYIVLSGATGGFNLTLKGQKALGVR